MMVYRILYNEHNHKMLNIMTLISFPLPLYFHKQKQQQQQQSEIIKLKIRALSH